jgi:hypothetical protein
MAFSRNRNSHPTAFLDPYEGKVVAWSTDGLRIVDADVDPGALMERLRAAGEDVQNLVYERIE